MNQHEWPEAELALVRQHQDVPMQKLYELLPHISKDKVESMRRKCRHEVTSAKERAVKMEGNIINFDISSWRNDWDEPIEVKRAKRVAA